MAQAHIQRYGPAPPRYPSYAGGPPPPSPGYGHPPPPPGGYPPPRPPGPQYGHAPYPGQPPFYGPQTPTLSVPPSNRGSYNPAYPPPQGYPPNRNSMGPASTMGGRSHSRTSLGGRSAGGHSQSRSLGASKASLASQRSAKSTIQQEYHDKQVREMLTAIYLGRARTPFFIAIIFFIIGFLLVVAGIAVIACRAAGWIFTSTDKGDFIGPALLVIGLIFAAIGFKFIYDAYQISAHERRRMKFTAASESMVSVNTISSKVHEPHEKLASGSATQNAITRTPHGSHNTLTAV